MPALKPYSQELEYSYAPGLFPSLELMRVQPERALRLLTSEKAHGEGVEKLRAICREHNVREEVADKALRRISGKENCFAAMVFSKWQAELRPDRPHVVLHHPSDCGNVGTILRTALGFGMEDVALIRPCVDIFDPRVVRASMGSLFSLRVHVYDDFEAYRTAYPAHGLYPFMLDGSSSLPDVLAGEIVQPYALIFGNEGSGLPASFAALGQPVRIPSNDRVDSLNLSIAAAIGIYGFTQKEAAHGAA